MQSHSLSTIVMCAMGVLLVITPAIQAADQPARIELKPDDAQGQLQILIDGKEALVYCYGKDVDLPHYFPIRSPSGKPLTVQQTNPFPHHRSLWFADTVELEGQRKASFYNAFYSRTDKKDPKSPLRDQVRHVEFLALKAAGNQAEFGEKLLWEMDSKTPVLDEQRQVRIVALDQGEYFLDLSFTVTASHGNVRFVSDTAHYAWPYVRMSPEFSVQKGGKMVNSEGGVNQKETHNKRARWIDYSNTIDGVTEGLAFFVHDPGSEPPLWLTRDYGTFGPRRMDSQNGKPFLLAKGESLKQRVGILVHGGDVEKAQVAQRYRQYVDGKL